MPRTSHRIEIINAHPRTRLNKAPIESAVRRTLVGEQVPRAHVTVILVDDDELLEMNRTHLSHDYYTDVITFPLEEDPLEGEIYISLDRAREQAAEYGVTIHNEVARLAAHGALHLAGYDDGDEESRELMKKLEDKYLGS